MSEMKDMLITFFGVFILLLRCTGAAEYTVCYEWEDPGVVRLQCHQDQVIRLKSAVGGRQRGLPTASDFCQNPSIDRNNDCVQEDGNLENTLFQQCNFQSNCERNIAFLNMDECAGRGYVGQKYFHIEYECISRYRHGSGVLFQTMLDQRPQPGTFQRTSFLHLLTFDYPSYINGDKNVCEITITGHSKLTAKILELRSIGSDPCPYKLHLNDNEGSYTQCAEELWKDSVNSDLEFLNSGRNNKSIQIAFKKQRLDNGIQGKVWLQFQTFSLVSGMEEHQGIVDLSCDFTAPIWPSATTTTTSAPVPTSRNVPIDIVPNSTTTDDPGAPVPEDVQKKKSKDKSGSFLPIIGGVAAGGLIILVIIIIIIVLLVRRYHINHKPAKSLDVIDAWDDASTLGKKKVVSSYSNGSSNYEPTSTTSTTISPYETCPSPRQSYMMNGEVYAEIPELPGSKSTGGLANHGYIFEDDLYSDGVNHNGNKVHMNGSHILQGSLDRRRVSELYAKPNKLKKKPVLSTSTVSSGGFDNPEFAGDLYEAAHHLDLKEDVYGYSTSLA